VTFADQRIAPETLTALLAAYPNDSEPILYQKKKEWRASFNDWDEANKHCFFRDKLKLECNSAKCAVCS